ncbi:MAG: hypothetical protein QG604_733 [Candidatus Dependentiae bacterium]|nr:hypothetical protein [Candidatus Dependentiae bacterium]
MSELVRVRVHYIFVGILIACAGVVIAQEEAADVLYAHEQWSAALAAYEKEEVPTPGTLVRMGECAARGKNYATALRHWYRASRGLYWLAYYDIATRIFRLEAESGLHGQAPTPSWYSATFCAAIPPLVWQLCLLFLLVFGAGRVRHWWRRRAYGLLSFVCLCIGLSIAFAWWSIEYRTAVSGVTMQSITVRSGPDPRFSELGKIPAATPVRGGQSAALPNGPLYSKITDGRVTGWVAQEALLLV